MTPDQIAELRPRLGEFAADMLGCLARSDQRATGELYLRGLLTDGRRKSMQPMAERLGVDHQRLQQFVTSSTWDFTAVRRRLSSWAAQAIGPRAYVIDDTGFPKDGPASACVAWQYSGTLGKTANCQIGVSVHAVNDTCSAAVDWRLFCPESWDDKACDDPEQAEKVRRKRAESKVPDDVRHVEKWRLALDMLDEQAEWGSPRLPVVADAGYGDCTRFRLGVEERGLDYVVALKAGTSAHPGEAEPVRPPRNGGRGRRPKPHYPKPASSLREIAMAAGRDAYQEVAWRQGTRKTKGNPSAAMTSKFAVFVVRPANRDIPRADDGTLPAKLLLVEWPDEANEPTDYWLSNLPAETPIDQLVDLAKIRWRIEHDYRELKTGLGLDHFEGRSWTGWNRHVTLVAIAQAFCTMVRLDPKQDAPA
ncbi:IS701 family transposase [Actinopolymorpha pittospori]|uniref:SRSO17 transposase n=1 Tax=Actinopolymorpha pittospori TaxID=648752 RepID=A0A927MRX9_9ACTN|nr:IS701 family transposase [Actinopolymorpha pittospori]MBE1605559.1 SRSO17 transposase [Actinopolymorpha pittospori]